MKIAFIYDAVYPFITGGAEKRVYELATRLAKRGHEVHWYGIGWWWTQENKNDIELEGIKLHGVSKPMDLYKGDKRSIKEAILFALKLFPKLMQEKFDIIDCQSFPYFSCFPAKIKSQLSKSSLCITWIEVWDDYWYEYIGKAGFFGKLLEKIVAYLTGNLIAISNKTKKDLNAIGIHKNIKVIPVGIDMNYINKIKPSKKKSDVIFTGRLIKEKNVDLLLKAIKIVKEDINDIKCFIIGEGPERLNLENLAYELEIMNNIVFIDFLDKHSEMISLMKSSKILVLPSTREGFGIVVIEANACGLPVVVVEHDMNAAVDLVINNKNGLISNFSEFDMASNIINLLNNKDKMYNDCIEMSKQYDWEIIVDSLENFYITANNSD